MWFPRDRVSTCWHEAGHATIGTILGGHLIYCGVTNEQVKNGGELLEGRTPDSNGVCCWAKWEAGTLARILTKYAGECALMHHRIVQDPTGSEDWDSALKLEP